MQKKIAIIGSTGSIGKQTLEVIQNHPENFRVVALACYENIRILEEQIKKFQPEFVAVYKKEKAAILKKNLVAASHKKIPKIYGGPLGWQKIATLPQATKIVFSAAGLTSISALTQAIKAHKEIALANKEIIVAAGESIMKLAKKNHVTIVPIDSEHSAIFQCLHGEDPNSIEKIILTCSGGPFYGYTKSRLQKVTAKDALNHPTWKMGPKITVDCATLLNKGFEIIEAKHLFGLKSEQIEIVIHPESIVHSLVQFKDGSVKAQIAPPDMRIPITYALAYPKRIKTTWPRLDFAKLQKLTFIKPDLQTFEGPNLARRAIKRGGKIPAILTEANDRAVHKFLKNKITFPQIYRHIKKEMEKAEAGRQV